MTSRGLPAMIRRLRKARKLTQAQLAKRARVTQSYVARLEGEAALNPSLPTLRRLAKALDVPVTRLAEKPRKMANVLLVKFDPVQAFPLDDKLTLSLLRLMLAANDV